MSRIGHDPERFYDCYDTVLRLLWGEHLHHGLWGQGFSDVEQAGREMVRHVGNRLRLPLGASVFDVGCAYGATGLQLGQEFGQRVRGITLSGVQAESAMPGADVQQGDWLDNRIPSAHFDGCVAIESLEHMADPNRAVAEVSRILKPGGRGVIATWMRAEDPGLLEKLLLIGPIQQQGRLIGQRSMEEMRELALSNGLRIESIDDLSHRVARSWSSCIKRAVRSLPAHWRSFGALSPRELLRTSLVVPKIIVAYHLGAIRYGVFTLVKETQVPMERPAPENFREESNE